MEMSTEEDQSSYRNLQWLIEERFYENATILLSNYDACAEMVRDPDFNLEEFCELLNKTSMADCITTFSYCLKIKNILDSEPSSETNLLELKSLLETLAEDSKVISKKEVTAQYHKIKTVTSLLEYYSDLSKSQALDSNNTINGYITLYLTPVSKQLRADMRKQNQRSGSMRSTRMQRLNLDNVRAVSSRDLSTSSTPPSTPSSLTPRSRSSSLNSSHTSFSAGYILNHLKKIQEGFFFKKAIGWRFKKAESQESRVLTEEEIKKKVAAEERRIATEEIDYAIRKSIGFH
jgi:hypothetical protein